MTAPTATPIIHAIQRTLWLATLVHVAVIVYGLFESSLLAGTAFATMSLIPIAAWSVRQRSLLGTSTTLAFVIGNVFTMAVCNYLYAEHTSLTRGTHHELTSWLCGIMSWGAALGCIATDALFRKPRLTPNAVRFIRSPELLAVAGAVFLAIFSLQIASIGLNARYDAGQSAPGRLEYAIGGVYLVSYPFFALLGLHLRGTATAPRNLVILATVGFFVLTSGLTGGREGGLRILIMLLIGASAGGMNFKRFAILGGAVTIAATLFFIIIGQTRGDSRFVRGSVTDKIAAVKAASEGDASYSPRGTSTFDEAIARLFEGTAQVVIDATEFSGRRAGFQHFDRLYYLFIPTGLAPEKLPLNDASEILTREYGIRMSETTHFPITLVADAHRRGGLAWVLGVGLFVGIGWRLWAQIICTLMPLMAFPMIALLSLYALRLYPQPVLGAIDVLAYRVGKMLVLIGGMGLAARMLGHLRMEPRRTMNPHHQVPATPRVAEHEGAQTTSTS